MRTADVRPDDHLTYTLAKVSHRLQLSLDQALHPAGLTLVQFSALAHIARSPALSSADLARLLLTTPQAVATLTRRLVAAGLIEQSKAGRGRSCTLALTDEGFHRLKRGSVLATEAERRALSALTIADQRRLATTLLRLLDDVD